MKHFYTIKGWRFYVFSIIVILFCVLGLSLALKAYLDTLTASRNYLFSSLTVAREIKKSQLEAYFENLKNDVLLYSKDARVANAILAFQKAFQKSDFPEDIRTFYIKKDNVKGSVTEDYNKAHESYHPIFTEIKEKQNYNDILLLDKSGKVVYSYAKNPDFGAELDRGEYKNAVLGKMYQSIHSKLSSTPFIITDFENYSANKNLPTAFVGAPVFQGLEHVGYLAVQIPVNTINELMTENSNWKNEGFLDTEQTYIIGEDLKMRTDSRFLIEKPNEFADILNKKKVNAKIIENIQNTKTTILQLEINSETAKLALTGKSGVKIITDETGSSILSSYAPLNIKGLNWAILSEIDEKEGYASIAPMKRGVFWLTGIMAAGLILSVILIYFSGYGTVVTLLGWGRNLDIASMPSDHGEITAFRKSREIYNILSASNPISGNDTVANSLYALTNELDKTKNEVRQKEIELKISEERRQVVENTFNLFVPKAKIEMVNNDFIIKIPQEKVDEACLVLLFYTIGFPKLEEKAIETLDYLNKLMEETKKIIEPLKGKIEKAIGSQFYCIFPGTDEGVSAFDRLLEKIPAALPGTHFLAGLHYGHTVYGEISIQSRKVQVLAGDAPSKAIYFAFHAKPGKLLISRSAMLRMKKDHKVSDPFPIPYPGKDEPMEAHWLE